MSAQNRTRSQRSDGKIKSEPATLPSARDDPPSAKRKAEVHSPVIKLEDHAVEEEGVHGLVGASSEAVLDGAESLYERARLENIRKNEEYLRSLGVDSVKSELAGPKGSSSSKPSRRGASGGARRAAAFAEPVRRSGRVTIDKLKAEADLLKKSGNTQAYEAKQAELDEMIAKKAADTFEPSAATSQYQNSYSRLAADPIGVGKAVNKPDDQEDTLWEDSLSSALLDALKSTSYSSFSSGSSLDAADLQAKKKSRRVKVESTGEMGAFHSPGAATSMSSIEEYTLQLSRLSVAEADVAKLTESRITSVHVHESPSKLIIAAGDKAGNLGLWDVDSFDGGADGVYKYKMHAENIAKLHTWHSHPSNLYSLSYDGTVRYLDIDRRAFYLAFEAPEDIGDVMYSDAHFAEDGNSCIFIGKSNGDVSFVDLRESSHAYSWTAEAQESKVNSVQLLPSDRNYLITAGSGKFGKISIYDVRKRGVAGSSGSSGAGKKGWKSLNDIDVHTKSINAAYASLDGSFLVSVSLDNTIRTFANFLDPNAIKDATTSPPRSMITTRHDNHTGRWLSTFRPAFDPKQPRAFAIGCMEQPRRVEIFAPISKDTLTIVNSKDSKASSKSGSGEKVAGRGGGSVRDASFTLERLHSVYSSYLASVCSRNCFHPTLNVIACGNSSGRVHVLREPKSA